jgi:ABC-type transport system substrate-binding protein
MGRIDRRALFTSGAAAALLAASGLSLAAAPRAGGQLRLALAGPDSLDAVMRGALFETLTEVGPDGVLRGELATGWTSDAGARAWTLDLRADATFQSGAPVTASEVAAALIAHGFDAAPQGAQRVRIALAAGDADLPYRLSDPALVIAARDGTGSGPYHLTGLREGRQFSAERRGARGWADRVQALVIADAAVRAEALTGGHVDIAELPAPDGLRGRGPFHYHPDEAGMVLAAHPSVGVPRVIGARAALDDGRIAQRWWRA